MYRKITVLTVLLFSLLFTVNSIALATGVDKMAVPNLEGYAGKTIKQEMKLEGTDPDERSGFWYTHYKKKDGDNEKMDITSWITIEPKEYTIKQGEIKNFTVTIKIPKEIEPGLWGATTEDAWKEGHSAERRSYLVFKDALGNGNVYSGLMIPISVKVLPDPNIFLRIINFIKQNGLAVGLSTIIIILIAIIVLRRKK